MTEFVWCMDSSSAKRNGVRDPLNPTNDIVIEPQLSVNRMLISSIELATMEFPRAQRLIESCWSRLYFFSGLPLIRHKSGNQLTILFDGMTLTAQLPFTLNPIVHVEKGQERNEYVLQTQYPHHLGLVDTGVQVVGLSEIVEGPFEIVSETEFAIRVATPPPQPSSATQLFIPFITSLPEIARLLTQQLNAPLSCPAVLVQYDCSLSRFVLSLCTDKYGTFARLVVDPESSLDLGFRTGEHRLSNKCPLVASLPPLGTTFICLSTGNYTIEQMLEEITHRFNMCFVPLPTTTLTIGDVNGSHTVSIVPGSYTPHSLAASLSELLAPFSISVSFTDQNRYLFASEHEFALEFKDPQSRNLVFQLGFRPTLYNGSNSYLSTDCVCPQQIVRDRFNVLVCDAQLNLDDTTIAFFFSVPRPAQNVLIQSLDEHHHAQFTSLAQAIGVQKDDVVELTFSSGQKRTVVVKKVLSGTQFIADVGPISLPSTTCSVRLLLQPRVSLLCSPNNPEMVTPEILGFGPCDLLCCGANCHISAPFAFRMIPWTYVLLEMVSPSSGSARIEHRFGSDHKTTILGKILLSYEPELERFFPMRATFFGGERVVEFRFRLLNPNHTPYQLHGLSWRATFRLNAEQNPQSLITGNFVTAAPDIMNPRLIQEAPYATA